MIKLKQLIIEKYIGTCRHVGGEDTRWGICNVFSDATEMDQVVQPNGNNFRQVSPEIFFKFVNKVDVPPKTLKGKVEYYRIDHGSMNQPLSDDEAGLWWIYNIDQDIHYFFRR
jgi:hypothetical protein